MDARGNQPAGVAVRQPLRDARQRRPPDSTAVRDGRLFRVPARARSREPRARRDRRPAPRERRTRADAVDRRIGWSGRRAAASTGARRRHASPAFQVLPRGRRGCVSIVSRRADHRSRSTPGRPDRPDRRAPDLYARRRAHAGDGGCAGGTDRERGACARADRRARSRATPTARPQPVVELGQRNDQPVSGARSGRVAGVRPQSGRAPAADSGRCLGGARIGAVPSQSDQLRVQATAGVSGRRAHVGRASCGRSLGSSGSVLFGGVRPPRIDPDLLRRSRDSGRRPREERVRPGHPARRRGPVLRPGVFQTAARLERLAA